jgi:GntR family transcriptional regulator/MocR family aminotransferase
VSAASPRSHQPVVTLVPIDASSNVALHEQIYRALRDVIVSGKLPTGARIPSSRMLSEELRVSRNTVLNAFEKLTSEGYLDSRVGGGTYVAPMLPDEALSAQTHVPTQDTNEVLIPMSKRGMVLSRADVEWAITQRKPVPFRLGAPAIDSFPFDLWGRITAKILRTRSPQIFGYGEPSGYPRLRRAVASYLVSARGVRCEPDQVFIVEGSQVALDLSVRLLADPGDVAWMEEPGFPGARAVLQGNGATIVPVPVDNEGISVTEGKRLSPKPRLIYVTPSHQFPLGVAMSPQRRNELIAFAAKKGAWILEDDYLSEFRYRGRPLQALQGIDRDGRVIYMGTFSKMLFPAVRIAYVVVPRALIPAFTAARAVSGLHASTPTQAVLAEFMTEGHFVRHLRRMRNLYWERQQVLIKAAAQEFSGIMSLEPADAGMHLTGFLSRSVDDRSLSDAASVRGVETVPLSSCYLGASPRSGLLLGYTSVRPPLIWRAARELAGHIRAESGSRAESPRSDSAKV